MSKATELARNAAVPFVREVDTLLDIGPGIRPQVLVSARWQIRVEPCEEYALWLMERGHMVMPTTGVQALQYADEINATMDTVVALDVLEHMEREEGVEFIRRALRIAQQQVIIFTPLGFLPQPESKDGRDAWGMSGQEWQRHRSGWKPDDFPGWRIVVLPKFHYGRRAAFFAIHG